MDQHSAIISTVCSFLRKSSDFIKSRRLGPSVTDKVILTAEQNFNNNKESVIQCNNDSK